MKLDSAVADKGGTSLSLERLQQMAGQVDESDTELLPFFEEEAGDELKKVEALLHGWHAAEGTCPLEDLRVRFHTLKGAANSIGQLRIGSLAGGMKDVLDVLNSEKAAALRADLTKASVLVLEAIRVLLREAHAPQYNQAKKEMILRAVQELMDLQQKAGALKPGT